MASSPSGRRTLYANRRYPGCMGGLVYLFDFNQALAGRKLLTDKKSGAGLEAPRNSLDVGGSIPEVPKPNAGRSEEVPYGYELHKASAPKKSNGMPIKALIAQELSKESDSKNRAPSVVARLMGLDALPTDSKTLQKPSGGIIVGNIDEKSAHKSIPERQRREEKLPQNVSRLYAKKAKASAVSAQSTCKSFHPQQSDFEDDKPDLESMSFRNHPQEQQLQEFKKEFEARQSQKLWGHLKRSARLDDLDSQLAGKQTLFCEKLHEAKLGLSQEKCSSSKINAPQERLHESKEFQDAMDFLQSNKDFFMRFLQEPNSLFARHLQDNELGSFLPPQPTQVVKHRRLHRAPDASEEYRPESWAKDSPVSRRNYKSDIKSSGADAMVGRNVLSMPKSPSSGSEESLGLQDQHKHAFSPMASENRLHDPDCHVPSRIVVLKPSPGRVRNLKSVSPIYSRSPQDHVVAKEVIREDSTDILEKLREKLRKGSNGEYKHERRNMRLNVNEHYRDASKDPREIAREIARQVRENVTRDLMVDPTHLRKVHSTARDTNLGRRTRQARESEDTAGSSEGEACAPTSRLYWDSYHKSGSVSLHQDNNFDMIVVHGSKEGKRNVSEHFRTKSTRGSDELLPQVHEAVMKKGGYYEDNSCQFSPGPKTSHNPKGSGRFSVDSFHLGQNYRHALFHTHSDRVEDHMRTDRALELEVFAHAKCGEESKGRSPRTLLRSQSVTMASTSVDQSQEQLDMFKGGAHLRDLPEVHLEKAAQTTVVESIRPIDVVTQSIDSATKTNFSKKNSELKGSFTTEEVKQTLFASEESTTHEPSEGLSVTSLKEQCQIEDNGRVLDNDSSVPSFDTLVPLGAVPTVEDPTDADNLTTHQLGTVSLASDTSLKVLVEPEGEETEFNCDSQSIEIVSSNNDSCISPCNMSEKSQLLLCSATDVSTSANPEPVKEQSEQPSPVSVLDLSFQEETSVSMEFKAISSDLQELQMCLHFLKFDDHNHRHESEPEIDTHQGEACLAGEEIECKDYDVHSQIDDNDALISPLNDLEHFDCVMVEMDYPSGKESEMLYVKNVLVASGFIGDSAAVLTGWYAPSQPLNPCLFQKMESSYFGEESEIQEHSQVVSKNCKQGGGMPKSSLRRLLFDSVNEVLFDVLGPHLNRRLWLSSHKLTVFPMPSGKDLLKYVWSHVCCLLCSHSEIQDTLENLVTKDLGKGGRWLDVAVEIEAVGLDVERAILDDLIEETLLVL